MGKRLLLLLLFLIALSLSTGCISNEQYIKIQATTGIPYLPHVSIELRNKQHFQERKKDEKINGGGAAADAYKRYLRGVFENGRRDKGGDE